MHTPAHGCLYTAIAAELLDIRAEMAALQLWDSEPPSAAALASEAPFCIDTLQFNQWIQFVFLVRMQKIIDERRPLPQSCDIAPMAEEYFKRNPANAGALIKTLRRVDNLICGRIGAAQRRGQLSS
ncbi:MAG: YqcC family protein [Gammaproteobacteria bacterium]|nr:YqcC family protein [Gammaproteobacteria bacterium]NND39449.1 YqcC family protein [Pseudomonadales bacterium]MBT8150945.1 YqcC family protein [Gammaproteobacteria bacterium]NNL11718.1 YqcC family protein [Pseudomonadales bacterium]NNM12262.1 YqcC family protein [Pseudomonadales bacterium]